MKVEVALPETVRVVPTFSAPVVVAAVVVDFSAVTFCRVVELLARMFPKVPRPVEVRLPVLAVWAKRRVVEAIPLTYSLVVVASVPVLEVKVNFCRVVELLARMFPKVPRPVEVRLPVLAV